MRNPYVWYSNDTPIDSPDTIHQTLVYGSLDSIKSLKDTLGEDALQKVFLEKPKKIYTKSSFNFIKNFILHITQPIDEYRYLKSTPRFIG